MSTPLRPRTPCSASKMRVCSIMRRASVVLSSGRPSTVAEDFDQRAAGAEEQEQAELDVLAAADDQLVAVELFHRLDGDALEMTGASTARRRSCR